MTWLGRRASLLPAAIASVAPAMASPVRSKRCNAARIVLPMSKHRPLLERWPSRYQRTWRDTWSRGSCPRVSTSDSARHNSQAARRTPWGTSRRRPPTGRRGGRRGCRREHSSDAPDGTTPWPDSVSASRKGLMPASSAYAMGRPMGTSKPMRTVSEPRLRSRDARARIRSAPPPPAPRSGIDRREGGARSFEPASLGWYPSRRGRSDRDTRSALLAGFLRSVLRLRLRLQVSLHPTNQVTQRRAFGSHRPVALPRRSGSRNGRTTSSASSRVRATGSNDRPASAE